MAFTQHGPPALGDWTPQPDFQAEQSKEDGWTATQSFLIARATLDLETFQDDFRIGRPINEISPEVEGFWGFLGLASIPRVKHSPGGFTIISVKFAGYTGPSGEGTDEDADPAPEPVPTYSLRASMSERDILFHPKVVAIADGFADDYGILLSLKQGIYEWHLLESSDPEVCSKYIDSSGGSPVVTWRPLPTQPSAGDAKEFAELIGRGIHTYLFPTFIWTKTWESTEKIKDADMADLGLVDEPHGDAPFPAGNAEGRDWMLISANQDQDGLKFRNSLEWELSDRGGWDALLYTE